MVGIASRFQILRKCNFRGPKKRFDRSGPQIAMQSKEPKNDGKYVWTNHVKDKMTYYRISESLIKRIIRFPKRIEEGIAPKTVAVMQPTTGKNPQEVWVMYQTINTKDKKAKDVTFTPKRRLISAWRYPGVSPVRGNIEIPDDVLQDLANFV